MKLFKKSVALLLAGALCAAALAGCTAKEDKTAPSGGYLTDSEGKPVAVENIATINGEPVPLEEFRYYFFATKSMYEQQFAQLDSSIDIWAENADLLNYVKETALQQLQFDRVMRKYAADNGISLTEEDNKAVEENVANTIAEMGGQKKYEETLSAMYLNETLFRTITESQLLQSKVQAEMQKGDGTLAPTDEEAKKLFDTYFHAKHILISTQGMTDEAEIAKKKETAEAALKRAQAGEDFDALVKEYGEDPGMEQSPDGYYFGEGEMVEEFYEGTKALEENGVSGLVESGFGWHIIQRLPIAPDYFETNKTELKAKMTQALVNTELDALMTAAVVEKTPEYEMISASNFK